MKVKEVKQKHLESVMDGKTRQLKPTVGGVSVVIGNHQSTVGWYGCVCGDKYYIRLGEDIITNLTETEQEEHSVYLNAQGKLIARMGETYSVIRKEKDIQGDKILVFYATRKHAEYFAVDAAISSSIVHLFVDERYYEQTLILQKMLLSAFLPNLSEVQKNIAVTGGSGDEK